MFFFIYVYLLDDPLAAVDVNVAKKIYNDCISRQGLLANKTRVLITHQTHFLRESDQTILLANGHIEAQGLFDQLSILQNFQSQKQGTVTIGKKDDNNTVTILAEELNLDKSINNNKSIVSDETSINGNVKWFIWFRLFNAPPLGWCGFILLIFILLITEAVLDGSNI